MKLSRGYYEIEVITIDLISLDAGLIIGAATFIGLLLNKSKLFNIIEAVIKVLLGYTILIIGSNLAIKQLSQIAVLIENTLSLSGIMPNNELIATLSQWFYGKKLSYIMIFGMLFHLVIARYTRFKHIFLTGHHILFMAALITGIIANTTLHNSLQIFTGSAILAILLSVLPQLSQPFMDVIFPNERIGLAHFGNFGFMLSGHIARIFGKKSTYQKDNIELNHTRILGNPNIIILIFTFSFVLFLLFLSGNNFISFGQWSKENLLYAFNKAFLFTAGMYIIIIGVRMMLQEILDSFQGIAEKLVPNSIPALDSPIIFPSAPQAVVIGFTSSIIGGIIGMVILYSLKINVVLPAITAHFFSGGTTGVFGYAVGGYRGSIIGSFVHGLLITFLPLLILPVMYQLGYTHTTFSETDFGIIGFLLNFLLKIFGLL